MTGFAPGIALEISGSLQKTFPRLRQANRWLLYDGDFQLLSPPVSLRRSSGLANCFSGVPRQNVALGSLLVRMESVDSVAS